MKESFKKYIEEEHKFDKLSMIGIICLIIVISGTFGFIYEVIFYFFNGGMKHLFWRGGNFLPWINIYATGALIIYILAYSYRKEPFKVFVISFLSCGVLEFFSGVGIYVIGKGLRYWDYNTEILNFGNIGGFICLRSVLFFGLSGMFLIYGVIPFCFYLARKMNKKVFLVISITLCSIVLADEIYNLLITKIFDLPTSTNVYTNMGIQYVKLK